MQHIKQFVITLCCVFFISVGFAQKTAVEYFALSTTLKGEKKYAEALIEIKKAIELNGNSKDYNYQAGWLCNELSKYAEAVPYLKKALSVKDDDANIYIELGYALYKLKKYTEAETAFNKAISYRADFNLSYKYLGDMYYEKSEDKSAAKPYYLTNFTLMKEKTGLSILYRLGWIYNHENKYDSAIIYLQKGIVKDITSTDCYNELGYAYYKQEKIRLASENYITSISYKPTQTTAYTGMGDIKRLKEKQYDSALYYYKRSVANGTKSASVYYGIGWISNSQKNYDTAIVYLSKAISILPKYSYAMTELGYSYIKLNNPTLGQQFLNESIAIEVTDANLYYLGLSYVNTKNKTKALEVLNQMKQKQFPTADNLEKLINRM
ncbi:MAG: tetratricopeptide repeat protein [Ferruginibacter sp.]